MATLLGYIGLALAVVVVLGGMAYLAGCAGADRWLSLREWWNTSP